MDEWLKKMNVNAAVVDAAHHKYWVTKQCVLQKLGNNEDEPIVLTDADLDTKIMLFKSIRRSSNLLLEIFGEYYLHLIEIADIKNSFGTFMKQRSNNVDYTDAGKALLLVGSYMLTASHEFINLQSSVEGIQQKLYTFVEKAVRDTRCDVKKVEKYRNEYRAALNWMKDISEELDPDEERRVSRFKAVQERVKRSKINFEDRKIRCSAKIDVLLSARSTTLSNEFVSYQETLSNFFQLSAEALNKSLVDFSAFACCNYSITDEELRNDHIDSISAEHEFENYEEYCDCSNGDTHINLENGLVSNADTEEREESVPIYSSSDFSSSRQLFHLQSNEEYGQQNATISNGQENNGNENVDKRSWEDTFRLFDDLLEDELLVTPSNDC